MPVSDTDRLLDEALQPRVVMLHRALARLRSCVSFMNTGAHPDDETSALLSVLGLRDGLDLSYACSTRGEGGQNDIGTEAGAQLGTLRTAEMESAAAELDLRLYWLPDRMDDSLVDFGFSKSGEETLGRWGRERTLQRFVSIVRSERPDILCPTFLDVPGQHGHHRAMTAAAHEVMALSADSAYRTAGLSAWQPKKLYLPAWGGGGSAYDDELPPPAATLVVEGRGRDAVTGSSYERLGQRSRRRHLTQGMGRWVADGEERDWPLHLASSGVSGPDLQLSSGLPASLAELSHYADAPILRPMLDEAQQAIDEALERWSDPAAVLKAAVQAVSAVEQAIARCPDHAADEVLHRLRRKCTQLARVVRLAAGIDVRARLAVDVLRPGEATALTVERYAGDLPHAGGTLSVIPVAAEQARIDTTAGESSYRLDDAASPSNPWPERWLPDEPAAPFVQIDIVVDGVTSTSRVAFESPPIVLPAHSVRLASQRIVYNRRDPDSRLYVTLGEVHPPGGELSLDLPTGWLAARTANGFSVTAPPQPDTGAFVVPILVDGQAARTYSVMNHSHVAQRLHHEPAQLHVRVLDVALPDARIGYVGGGNDRVADDLAAVGLSLSPLDDDRLASAAPFDGIDTLLVGLFAMRTRPALVAALPRLHAWVEAGGHLVTLYHRPWDGWDPQRVPPRPLTIGQPSLRWRVTDEAATVTPLLPRHALLNEPNVIGDADWAGWHKERGLYFASDWDACYQPLLSMSDAGEAPLLGALLAADIGAGRHVHTSLILHHQLRHGVPGAFRLMANLLA